MIDDPLTLLSLGIWLMAAGMYPLGFLFGACSVCCEDDPCPWLLSFDRCLRVSFVGSNPPEGGDCRVFSSRAGTGDVQYMASNSVVQIHNVQSQIRVTVRLSLSASGASRTPVGETRTQVWRFNRATPTIPASTTYDVLGPPWHLQVDLSVTGVATQEEAGVTSSIGEDEHGQPKLILTVTQWTSTITHDEVMTLFPTGLQRWGPGLSGTQTFRLTTGTATPTRVEGDAYSGWSVSKLSGLTIDERALAVRLSGAICTLGGDGSVQRTILNDDENLGLTAVEFLNGDEEVRVSVGLFERDLRILPNNVLCETPSYFVGVGAALGIYPRTVHADAPQLLLEEFPDLCSNALTIDLHIDPFVSCPDRWSRGLYNSGSRSLVGVAEATPADFWSGTTLLWNANSEPYRNSFTGSGPNGRARLFGGVDPWPGWTYRITGGNTSPVDKFLESPLVPFEQMGCRDAEKVVFFSACVPNAFTFGNSTFTYSQTSPLCPDNHAYYTGGTGYACLSIGCDPASSQASLYNFQDEFVGTTAVSASHRYRRVCGSWSPSEFSAEGGEATRACDITDLESSYGTESETAAVPASRSRLPRVLNVSPFSDSAQRSHGSDPEITQSGRCRLIGLRQSTANVFNQSVFVSNPLELSIQAGQCVSLVLRFGETNEALDFCLLDPSALTSVPCDNCTPTVTITSGEEYADVKYRSSGVRAGTVDVIAKTTWLGGQGVTFTVSCGSDTITQTVQRAP